MRKVLILILLVWGAFWAFQQVSMVEFSTALQSGIAVTEPANSQEPMSIEAQGAILIDQGNGKVIFRKNADARLYPASTTKILTALLAIENADLDEIVTVGKEIGFLLPKSSTAGLHFFGEKIAVRDLTYGLMLPSGSDAAHTLAVHIGRKTSRDKSLDTREALAVFSDLMNRRARRVGAKDSHFVNPDGYTDENHYSTAYDMAMIAQEAMREPFFRRVVGTESYRRPNRGAVNGKTEASVWENTNNLLDKNSPYYFPGVTGIKTGFTSAAGYCLVSSASREGLNLIAVVLNSSKTGVLTDSRSLLNYGFKNYKPQSNWGYFFLLLIGLSALGLLIMFKGSKT